MLGLTAHFPYLADLAEFRRQAEWKFLHYGNQLRQQGSVGGQSLAEEAEQGYRALLQCLTRVSRREYSTIGSQVRKWGVARLASIRVQSDSLVRSENLFGANVSTTQYLSHGGRRSYSSMNSISLRGSCAIERPHPGRVLCAGHSHL